MKRIPTGGLVPAHDAVLHNRLGNGLLGALGDKLTKGQRRAALNTLQTTEE